MTTTPLGPNADPHYRACKAQQLRPGHVVLHDGKDRRVLGVIFDGLEIGVRFADAPESLVVFRYDQRLTRGCSATVVTAPKPVPSICWSCGGPGPLFPPNNQCRVCNL